MDTDTDNRIFFRSSIRGLSRTRFAWRAGYLLAAFGIYLADQASKAWAVRRCASAKSAW